MSKWLSFLVTALIAAMLAACTVQPVAPAASTPAAVDEAATAAPEEEGAAEEELSGELIVFAAASLTDAFGEIATNFQEQHPGTTVVHNFAGSQQLVQQLGQGAPA